MFNDRQINVDFFVSNSPSSLYLIVLAWQGPGYRWQGPGYRWSPHPITLTLFFLFASFHVVLPKIQLLWWVLAWGLLITCDQRIAICFSSLMVHYRSISIT
jgi:uncharacterized BrkB/YihY/UPF0761 family membrane protein